MKPIETRLTLFEPVPGLRSPVGSFRELLYNYTGLKQPEIGKLLCIDYTGVSVARKRRVQLLEKDRQLKKIMEQMRKELREA
jgi:hypothetical protein